MLDQKLDASTKLSKIYKVLIEKRKEAARSPIPVLKREFNRYFPLSFSQERLWFLDQLEPGGSAYNLPSAFRLKGKLNQPALELSFNRIVERHEILRTVFGTNEGRSVQVILPEMKIGFSKINLQDLPEDEKERKIRELGSAEAESPFDLARGPLIRVILMELNEEEHVMIVNMHHIISDGWSMGIFFKELTALYEAYSLGKPSPLPEPSLQFADYASWQRQWLQGNELENQLNFWKQKLDGAPAFLDLPMDRPRPPVQTHVGSVKSWSLSKPVTEALKKLSLQEGNTLFMTCFAAFNVLLYRYSRQEDIVVGTPVAGRNRDEVENLIGFFVNTLALRTDLSGNPTFREILGRVWEMLLGVYAHQDLPFEKLVEELKPERNVAYTPIFQVMFDFDNFQVSLPELLGLTLDPVILGTGEAMFDLTLTMEDRKEELAGFFEYNTDLFDAATIERMSGHFLTLLTEIINNPGRRIADLTLLSGNERRQLLVEWNDSKRDYPQGQCLHQLFEAQAAERPDQIAVVFQDRRLSFQELNEKANQLAHNLRKLNVGPESLVGICMERSLELIIGLLGILKAGGAYLPFDPVYPRERLSLMFEDARVPVLLIQNRLTGNLPPNKPRVIELDDWEPFSLESKENPVTNTAPRNLAYIIYTSGSTGKPKGVLIEHRNIVTQLEGLRLIGNFNRDDRHVQVADFTFDMSVQQIFLPLVTGGTLFIITKEIMADPLLFQKFLRQNEINVLDSTPALLSGLEYFTEQLPLKSISVGGEIFNLNLFETIKRKFRAEKIFNLYGPTETAVNATFYLCQNQETRNNIPIGGPMPNYHAFILDEFHNLVPIGVPGELYVSGDGVGRGYLNRPELTAEKFIPNPFDSLEFRVYSLELNNNNHDSQLSTVNSQLYKTGDLARWLPDGKIDFLGRVDFQVKIRGFRIELEEIEAILGRHSAVQEVTVIVSEDRPGDQRLVAYVVLRQERINGGELRKFLEEKLPSYMVPSNFVFLEMMPLNSNGKIDRKALPAPDRMGSESSENLTAPRTPAEEVLAGIWAGVLGLNKVGVHDNFFELGGHSLLATRAISKVRDAFRVEIPLRSLFESPTVASLAKEIEKARRVEQGSPIPPIRLVSREGDLPLSFSQERLWFLDQMEPGSATYNISLVVRLTGELNQVALEQSLNKIIERHETLRTVFAAKDGRPVQVVLPRLSLEILTVSLEEYPENEREEKLRRLAGDEARNIFDLGHGPLLRASLLKLSEKEYVLILMMHHIISDGWSTGIFFKELTVLYDAFSGAKAYQLPDLPIQYADYASWQKQWLQGAVLENQVNYWKQKLNGAPAVLDLPTDRPRPPVQTFRGAIKFWIFSESTSEAVKRLSLDEGSTLFMTYLAAYQVLLSRYSRQDDLVVGTPVAGRNRSEFEDLIGFFINTLALRADLTGNLTFRELLGRVREMVLEAYAHQDLPFEKLVEELNPERNLTYTPIFQVMFAFQNFPISPLELPGLTLSPIEVETGTAKFDLTLFMEEREEGLIGVFEYNLDLFDPVTIDRMAGHLKTLLKGIIDSPGKRIAELPFLTEAEQRQLLVEWNDTKRDFPGNYCIHQLFEDQVERTPDQVGLVFGNQELTYGQLNEKANQLAHYLRKLHAGPEVPVGICLERSFELIIGILGILKSGGTYLPLDPAYPGERLNWMLEDAQVPVLLTQKRLEGNLPRHRARVIFLDDDWERITLESKENPAGGAEPRNLAYIIYTSGSTGKPKGTAIQHRSAVAFINWAGTVFTPEELAGVLASTSVCFDLSVFEFFVTLSYGGKVILTENLLYLHSITSPVDLTLINTVPSAMNELMRLGGIPSSVLTVNLAGEPLSNALVQKIYGISSVKQVFNLYGPTEDTIYSTFTLIKSDDRNIPSIGRPISNTQAYILDKYLQPVPVGVPGELYLAGAGLARGYLNRPDLTAEKFIPNPFNSLQFIVESLQLKNNYQDNCQLSTLNSQLYKTGDLARWLPDGRIEFLGRIDHQVKIRGFRIELEEIQAVLYQYPSVQEVTVQAREDLPGEKRLVAYVVPKQEGVSVSELRNFLKGKLPDYMVPSNFVFLKIMPRTPNGKIDRKALPAPESLRPESAGDLIAPRTPLEKTLTGIWAGFFGLSQVSVFDNFFELGGHSLLVIQAISKIRDALGVEIPLREFFKAPTIADLAKQLEKAPRFEQIPQIPINRTVSTGGDLPLSFSQERLWFLDQMEPGGAAYNIPVAIRLTGKLNQPVLEQSLRKIMERHETLRTIFPMKEGRPVQVIIPSWEPEVSLFNLEELPGNAREEKAWQLAGAEAAYVFDLAHGPLLRVTLFTLSQEEHILLLNMHHIISDGWSMGIFFKELAILYEAYSLGKSPLLSEIPIQYVDYAFWQRKWLQGEVLETQLKYWRQKLNGAPAILDLPGDRPRSPVQTFSGASRSWTLPKTVTEALKKLSLREGSTLFMTLLAALQVLLYRYSNQDDLVVGTPVAGRNRSEIEGLIGFFVNTIALRTDLSGTPSFVELLGRVREMVLEAYTHQDLPFEKLVEELKPERSMTYTPIFQVMFVLQNFPIPRLELPGLSLSPVEVETATTKFDLTLSMDEREEGLAGFFEFNTDIFNAATIDRMIEHFQTLVKAITENPGRRITDLPLLTMPERHQILVEWNDTQITYSKYKCLHELFEEQAELNPEALAVADEEQQLDYRELNSRANQLAHYLRSLGVGPEAPVGICVERSTEMIVGLLGILKAGGAYLPLDPIHPNERLAFMLKDAQVSILLIQQRLLAKAPSNVKAICLDTDWERIAQECSHNPAIQMTSGNLAYVIYTSGSTGVPKGIAVPHAAAINLVAWHCRVNYVTSTDRATQVAGVGFDATVLEIWPYLLVGAGIFIVENRIRADIPSFIKWIAAKKITISFLPTPLAEVALDEHWPEGIELRILLTGGDKLYSRPREGAPFTLTNNYGPAECTVVATWSLVAPGAPNVPSIGRPIDNTQVYILDHYLQPVPVGVPGEIYIGGAGLSRGYVGRPDLTAEKFIPNPFNSVQLTVKSLQFNDNYNNNFQLKNNCQLSTVNSQLYKTGDLARWLPDGNIEFLGRKDFQVKIRGFRVELGEIEAQLLSHELIKEAVVVAKEGKQGEKYLCAYLVLESGLTVSELRGYLAKDLPEFMIPAHFVALDKLPLTSNGKVDRKALPEPDGSFNTGTSYVPPQNELEESLAGIWREVLGVEKIGINDNFFELGGHSLLVIRLIDRIEKQFREKLPPASIFSNATIKELAAMIDQGGGGMAYTSLVPIQRSGSNPPLFFVHPILGDALGFSGLARYLGMDQPFYGLQAAGLNGEKEPHGSIEEMAGVYIRELQTIQSTGPYLLGGYSAGGTVALEIARQLEKQGQEIGLLIVLDGASPSYKADLSELEESDFMIMFLEQLGGSVGVEMPGRVSRELKGGRPWEDILEEMRMMNLWPVDLSDSVVRNRWKVFQSIGKALLDYRPEVYRGSIVLLRAVEELAGDEDPLLKWDEVAGGGVKMEKVPGNHFTVLKEPKVKVLAEKIKEFLKQN